MSAQPHRPAGQLAADGLMDFLRRSPSPMHAAASAAELLIAAGFRPVAETAPFPPEPGRYFLIRGGSLVAWVTEQAAGPATAMRVVGAHTDSPNLRIKPRPDFARAGYRMLGVEVYGGPLLNSWLDRDLGLSGRVSVRAAATLDRVDNAAPAGVTRAPGIDPAGVATVLIHIDEPLLRVAQLAVHLDRAVNTNGLVLNPQQHLAPIWALDNGFAQDNAGDGALENFRSFVADRLSVDSGDILGWDLMTHDVQPPARIGADAELIAGGRMDNLATSYAGTTALIEAADAVLPSPLVQVLVLFDHEEVGSVSERGAYSTLLPAVLERIVIAAGGTRDDFHRAMAGTVIASGDMAHATHPNYADRHEPEHHIGVGGGPVLKINNQLRYATGAPGAAAFRLACEQASVPMQQFVTRSDLPCGSTVGPITAARTGAETVDFGAPMLSMHSARELAGVADQAMYAAALEAFLAPL